MNKDKLIDKIKKEISEAYNRELNECDVYYSGMHRGQKEGLEIVLELIQSEPEETCTYSKDQVAELILEYALDLENSKNFTCDMETDDVLYWLNEKAGE